MTTAITTWSPQQLEIFDWFKTSIARGKHSRHLIVRARAGTGKSTTIRQGVAEAPEEDVLVAAFSKNIQLAMEAAFVDAGIKFDGDVKTLHATGLSCVSLYRNRIRVDFKSGRADALALAACGKDVPTDVVKLVSKLHTKAREIKPHATEFGELSTLQIAFECIPDRRFAPRFDAAYVERKALDAMVLAADVQDGATIDGADMIFLPLRNKWLVQRYDLVVVDEAQDMTVAQLEVAQGVLREGGRICIVGDDKQAIFAFRGADSGSLDRLKGELLAAELGLTTTYRCGKNIVDVARAYVPDFEAGPDNPDGVVRNLLPNETLYDAAAGGDFVLSRVNAPLVSIAMRLLRNGKRARVAGKDIGYGLKALLRKLNAKTIQDLVIRIGIWSEREVEIYTRAMQEAKNGRKAAFEAKIETINDQADMLTNLCDGARSVDEVFGRIEALFTDDGLGQAGVITCSSVHRAKGLEAERVFILRDTLRNDDQEEENICYVAITRAKRELVWVKKEQL